jgi:hypothetical protein
VPNFVESAVVVCEHGALCNAASPSTLLSDELDRWIDRKRNHPAPLGVAWRISTLRRSTFA